MSPDANYNFLQVRGGRTYFARVFVRIGSIITNGSVTIFGEAGAKNPHTPDEWLRSAVIGAEAAVASYENIRRGSPGIIVTTVMGTEVDTTANAVEIAAFCATWKALGGDENRLKFQFDNDWMVQVQAD